jgi:hypothetical protein
MLKLELYVTPAEVVVLERYVFPKATIATTAILKTLLFHPLGKPTWRKLLSAFN